MPAYFALWPAPEPVVTEMVMSSPCSRLMRGAGGWALTLVGSCPVAVQWRRWMREASRSSSQRRMALLMADSMPDSITPSARSRLNARLSRAPRRGEQWPVRGLAQPVGHGAYGRIGC